MDADKSITFPELMSTSPGSDLALSLVWGRDVPAQGPPKSARTCTDMIEWERKNYQGNNSLTIKSVAYLIMLKPPNAKTIKQS